MNAILSVCSWSFQSTRDTCCLLISNRNITLLLFRSSIILQHILIPLVLNFHRRLFILLGLVLLDGTGFTFESDHFKSLPGMKEIFLHLLDLLFLLGNGFFALDTTRSFKSLVEVGCFWARFMGRLLFGWSRFTRLSVVKGVLRSLQRLLLLENLEGFF